MHSGHNIALGKPTTANDVMGSSPEFAPSQLVDGKAATMYHAAAAGAGSFVSVDLQVCVLWWQQLPALVPASSSGGRGCGRQPGQWLT